MEELLDLENLSIQNPKLFKEKFAEVVRNIQDLSRFSEAVYSKRKSHGGRLIKTTVGNWIVKNLTEQAYIDYNTNPGKYSLKDILKIYHPRVGTKTQKVDNPLFGYILGKKTNLGKIPKAVYFDLQRAGAIRG